MMELSHGSIGLGIGILLAYAIIPMIYTTLDYFSPLVGWKGLLGIVITIIAYIGLALILIGGLFIIGE